MSNKKGYTVVANQPNMEGIYNEFIQWFSLPANERIEEYGCKRQKDFAEKFDVSKDTLSLWKKREDFGVRVGKIRNKWGLKHTGSVFAGWRNSCLKGNPYAIELWLSYFLGWDKTQIVKQVQEFTQEDLLTLIKVLPKHKQQYFYDTVNKIIFEAKESKQISSVGSDSEHREMGEENEYTVEGIKQIQADKFHADESAGNEVAADIQKNVCDGVERKSKENNN